MLCAVTELFHQGCRLRRDEVLAREPTVGHLFVSPAPNEENDGGRIQTVARLVWIEGLPRPVVPIPVLINPMLVRMTRRGFVLRGFQLTSSNGRNQSCEVAQEWWATPVDSMDQLPAWMRAPRSRKSG